MLGALSSALALLGAFDRRALCRACARGKLRRNTRELVPLRIHALPPASGLVQARLLYRGLSRLQASSPASL